jgi:hypothetical protein
MTWWRESADIQRRAEPNRGVKYNKHNLKGMRFGMLTALCEGPALPSTNSSPSWYCRCDCGGETYVSAGHLRSGNVKSCGCMRKRHMP